MALFFVYKEVGVGGGGYFALPMSAPSVIRSIINRLLGDSYFLLLFEPFLRSLLSPTFLTCHPPLKIRKNKK